MREHLEDDEDQEWSGLGGATSRLCIEESLHRLKADTKSTPKRLIKKVPQHEAQFSSANSVEDRGPEAVSQKI